MYCEDSAAVEVEHHHPKAHYPELAFAWENYLYACGPCNRPKNSKFAIFSQTGKPVLIFRKAKDPFKPPPLAGVYSK